jgi:hypothetical protein
LVNKNPSSISGPENTVARIDRAGLIVPCC